MILNHPEHHLQEHHQVIVDIILHQAKNILIQNETEIIIMNAMEAVQEALPPPRSIESKKAERENLTSTIIVAKEEKDLQRKEAPTTMNNVIVKHLTRTHWKVPRVTQVVQNNTAKENPQSIVIQNILMKNHPIIIKKVLPQDIISTTTLVMEERLLKKKEGKLFEMDI